MLNNFILQTIAAPGTATNCNLIAAPAGRINFNAKFATGATMFYVLDDGVQGEWGIGTLTTGSPDVLARTTVVGNTSGTTAKLNFAGLTRAFNALPGENAVYKDASGNITAGIVSLVEPSTGIQTLGITASGASGANIRLTGNGATTPTKYIRALSGQFQIVNHAYTTAILSLTDAGVLTTAGVISTNYDSLTGGQFRMSIGSGVGSMWRNDGTNTYLLLTASGSPLGGFNSMRPFSVAGLSGGVTIDGTGAGTQFGGTIGAAGSIKAGTTVGGYGCKTGYSGGFGSQVFNFYWDGTGLIAYVDNTSLGYIIPPSDARFKKDVVPMEDDALVRIMQLNPIVYSWQDKGLFRDDGIRREGFLAQEVQKIIPSGVTHSGSEEDIMSPNPMPIIAVTVKSIQEMKYRINDLEARLQALETK